MQGCVFKVHVFGHMFLYTHSSTVSQQPSSLLKNEVKQDKECTGRTRGMSSREQPCLQRFFPGLQTPINKVRQEWGRDRRPGTVSPDSVPAARANLHLLGCLCDPESHTTTNCTSRLSSKDHDSARAAAHCPVESQEYSPWVTGTSSWLQGHQGWSRGTGH